MIVASYPRAANATQPETPSKTPVSITQSLSELRLVHARLLEDHGINLALLRKREAELADADERNAEANETIDELQSKLRLLMDTVTRLEHAASLADREVGFLQALNVRNFVHVWALRDAFAHESCRQAMPRKKLLVRTLLLTTSRSRRSRISRHLYKTTRP